MSTEIDHPRIESAILVVAIDTRLFSAHYAEIMAFILRIGNLFSAYNAENIVVNLLKARKLVIFVEIGSVVVIIRLSPCC